MSNKAIESKINMEEAVHNQDRKFGEALEYYPVVIEVGNGLKKNALFTKSQLEQAMSRADNNPEDCPPEKQSWLTRLFG
ncbi:hypothetical protein GR7B_00162 [Vibrio phage vB_VcorM_GR7B]|nr:hypothetical protein GR7B_00162 [Vibrio phage vB_VcorM_GR7B]